MAKIYKHKSKGWQVHYTLFYPDRPEARKFRCSKSKARALELFDEAELLERRAIRGELSRQDVVRFCRGGLISEEEASLLFGRPVDVPTLGDLADTFEKRSKPNCRKKTAKVNTQRINTVLDFFGRDCRADLVTKDRVIEYRLHRLNSRSRLFKEGSPAPLVSAATVNKEVIKLAQVLDMAVESGAIPANPAREVKPVKDGRGRLPRALSKKEITALLKAAGQFPDLLGGLVKPIMQVYLYTGMRREELLMLLREDVNLARRTIVIQGAVDAVDDESEQWTPKTRQPRVIGINQELLPVLKALPRSGRYLLGGDAPLCVPDSMSRLFRKIRDKAELPASITLHSLRHTYITHLLESGVSLRRVQYLAGHARISTTERYIHLLPGEISEDRLSFL